jgi:hypothetical protein
MKNIYTRLGAAILVVGLPLAALAGDMKNELKIEPGKRLKLRTLFRDYGYRPQRSLSFEKAGLHLKLPADTSEAKQTGIYSLFSLAGDCEVIMSYEILNLPVPTKGYGAGVGLAIEPGDNTGWGAIQRVTKPKKEGTGYVTEVHAMESSVSKLKEEYKFQKATPTKGRIGLRRVKKELVFLASESATAPLEEIEKLPFTDHTITKVRFFIDNGESPTAADIRIRSIEVRADEITGGLPTIEPETKWAWWQWFLTFGGSAAVLGLLFWVWRVRRLRAPEAAAVKTPVKALAKKR